MLTERLAGAVRAGGQMNSAGVPTRIATRVRTASGQRNSMAVREWSQVEFWLLDFYIGSDATASGSRLAQGLFVLGHVEFRAFLGVQLRARNNQ